MTPENLKKRSKQFALSVFDLIDDLPNSAKGRMVANQLGRSASSVGANYRAVCRARSDAEFISKMGTVIEEADESAYWLELIIEEKILSQKEVLPMLNEANELLAIFCASRTTARKNTATQQSKIKNRKSEI